jgi:hypothetical protein
VLSNLIRRLILIPGWHTRRKILVIESDDWGCHRSYDRASLSALSAKLPHINDDPYTRLETLETNDDLEALFEVMDSVKDSVGNPAVITANTIMANPDYDKIRESDLKQYFYKSYLEDLHSDPKRDRLQSLIKEGIQANVYRPQLHGREHLNVNQWLGALQTGHKELLEAFKHSSFGIPLREKVNKRKNVMAAFDFAEIGELKEQADVLAEAQEMFKSAFGYRSTTFIPPAYIWNTDIEAQLVRISVKAVQGISYQYIPEAGGKTYTKKFRYTGKISGNGLINLSRNSFFEPSLMPFIDAEAECIKRINIAFQMNKPAIIGSHRVNFLGELLESNRTENLMKLKSLLNKIVKLWPDVEFLDSSLLFDTIRKDLSNSPN